MPVIPPAARVAQIVALAIGVLLALIGLLAGAQLVWIDESLIRLIFAAAFLLLLEIPGFVYMVAGWGLLRPQRRLPRTITVTAAIGTFGGLAIQAWFGELISPGLLLISAHGAVLLSVILATRAWQQTFKSGYATPTGYGFQPIINLPPQARRHYPTPPPPAMGTAHPARLESRS